MKLELNQDIVYRLDIENRPAEGVKRRDWPPNTGRKPFVVTDTARSAPQGFCVRVTGKSAVYYIQRRIRSTNGSGDVLSIRVGPVSSMTLDDARKSAAKLADQAHATGINPSKVARERDVRDLTMEQVLGDYRTELTTRRRPAKDNSLRSFDKAARKLDPWAKRRITSLTDQEILERFDTIAAKTPTTAEQTMRWATTAVSFAIREEARLAARKGERPVMTYNPFSILNDKSRYRTRAELERQYKETGKRSPLTLAETFGPWLKAIYARYKENRVGCSYLILATLWGCRKAEASNLRWRHKISEEEARTSSYVDLEQGRILLRDTKNRLDHTMALTTGARRLLDDLLAYSEEKDNDPFVQTWVFPARSTSRLRKNPFYNDSRSLRLYVCKDANLIKWTVKTRPDGSKYQVETATVGMHDLRRSFGGVCDAMHLSATTTKRLLNHFQNPRSQEDDFTEHAESISRNVAKALQNKRDLSDVTTRYTDPDWGRLKNALGRIEATILRTYPALYNALLTPPNAPMQEIEPTPLVKPAPLPGIPVGADDGTDEE